MKFAYVISCDIQPLQEKIMSVPLKSKLSYAWARATRKDRLYSHVFENKISVPVYDELHDGYGDYTTGKIEGYVDSKVSQWLKAAPMEGGKSNQYLITKEEYSPYPVSHTSSRYSGVYTYDQAQRVIKAWESEQMKAENVLPSRKQPFKAYIKTRLTTV